VDKSQDVPPAAFKLVKLVEDPGAVLVVTAAADKDDHRAIIA
jgi:hypothetical protein